MTLDPEFLRDLCLAPGAGGDATAVERVLAKRLAVTMPAAGVRRDTVGNVLVTASSGPPTILLAAHADQIGAVVTGADDRGFLWVAASGLLDAEVMPGRLVSVHTANGPRKGVVGRMPNDFLTDDARSARTTFTDLWLDIGAGSREEALSLVAVGDPVTFTPEFAELAGGLVASQALDDRAGLYAVVRALELCTDSARDSVTAVATAGEETGFVGARNVTLTQRPDIVVVVDVTWASDHPTCEPRRLGGDIRLGAGPVLNRGAGLSERLYALLRDTAFRQDVPVQMRAVAGATLSDADELLATPGAETLAVSVALRYMHSPVEVASGRDIELTARLLAAFIERVAAAPD